MNLNPNDLNYSSSLKSKNTLNSKLSSFNKNHAVNLNHFNQKPTDSKESNKKDLFSIKKDINQDVKMKPHNFRTSKNSRK